MPGMSGPACVQAFRKLEKDYLLEQRTHVVGLINDDYKDFEAYLEAGYDEFINKPVNKRTLDELVKRNEEMRKGGEGEDGEQETKEEEGKMVGLREESTLLAVDDNFFILNGMSRLKIKYKYKMQIAKGGKAGLQMYLKNIEEGFNYHCIFIDIEMPDMRGPDLVREIRKFEKIKNIPKIWICGLTTEDDRDLDEYFEAGFDEFLGKPVNPTRMEEVVGRRVVE
jgi:CheY-like chemotaxis protein